MKYENIREEELKNKVARDYFGKFDSTKIIGNIDFCVTLKNKISNPAFETQSLFWAEAKAKKVNLINSLVQLILTIGKARTFDKNEPPNYLGAFDNTEIAFLPYDKIQNVFYKNDFNWNVRPSDHKTKEFNEVLEIVKKTIEKSSYVFDFQNDDKEIKAFINNNFIEGKKDTTKQQIDKNNFFPIYLRWLDIVKPLIDFDFVEGKKQNILDREFYLADLFVDDQNTQTTEDDISIKKDLFVVYKNGHYEIAKKNLKALFDATITIKDKKQYENFWKKYKRPPIAEYQDYIVKRNDLLVPQDIRERKGAFFTPKQWVELSQKYITDVLGENWQDEYTIWDCAATRSELT